MQLLLAIVQDQDASNLSDALLGRGFRLTRINTVGGFLRAGNVTVLMAVEDGQVAEALAVIAATCRTRRSFMNAAGIGGMDGGPAMLAVHPIEVEIGGATVFTFPVRRLCRLKGGPASPDVDQCWPADARATGGILMQLVLGIVHSDAADTVTDALVAAGYRVTRISTAGGFLRRSNATLLVGVEEEKVDDVVKVIHDNCQLRAEPAPAVSGTPAYCATVFVLDASSYQHI
jgi:uncharacterized protein YaaQ